MVSAMAAGVFGRGAMNGSHGRGSAFAQHAKTMAVATLLAFAALLPRPATQWLAELCSTPMLSDSPARQPNASSRPLTTVCVLSREPLPHVPGKSVTTAIVDFPPCAYTARIGIRVR